MHTVTRLGVVLLTSWSCGSSAQPLATERDFLPTDKNAVVQVLAPRQRVAAVSASPSQVQEDVRALIMQSRQSADPRFLGRAQALLMPWWNRADAPTELAILQATIEQSRHLFDNARKTLVRVNKAQPRNSQALLTLATIERVTGNYLLAGFYCEQLAVSGASVYALACLEETRSLQGKQLAGDVFFRLASQQTDRATKAWLLSLAAEHAERVGNDTLAEAHYKASLQIDPDVYTSLAFSDLLLRTGKVPAALLALQALPDSDAVVLRRAHALTILGDYQASMRLQQELRERFEAMRMRAEDSRLHGRELALFALWLEKNPVKALAIAESSLAVQKEPLDWWVYLASARATGDATALAAAKRQFESSGLADRRVRALLEPT
jgi:tetratricopeptide (TPR) repeat protein